MFEIPTATQPPRTTTSADGTTIAYDVEGAGGPLVVLVGGATATRLMSGGLVSALAAQGCTAAVLDRRGRGDSTDTQPYDVQREIEDIAAVVEAIRPGGAAVVAGFSSGAALTLRAAAHGAQVERAVAFEPPYRLPDSPPIPADYVDALEAFTAADDHDGALEYFQREAVGLPQEMIDGMKGTPFWDYVAATAPTLAYDGYCLGGNDQSFPTALVAGIAIPVLALASDASPPFLQKPAAEVGATGPHASYETLPGEFHHVPDDVLAPRIAAFAQG